MSAAFTDSDREFNEMELMGLSSDDDTYIPETPVVVPSSWTPSQLPRSDTSAAEQADMILNSRATAAAHQYHRRNSNVLHGAMACLYPHLERFYEGDDDDALARIAWNKCEPSDLWNVLTSKHLACGKTTSMAFSFRECLKKLKDITTPELKAKFEEGLKDVHDKHVPALASLKTDFLVALSHPGILGSVQTHMEKYHANKKIRIKDGLFPKFTSTQVNKVRIAAFMASASCQPILHEMHNPPQTRAAIDDHESRVIAARTALYQKFTDVVNSDAAPDNAVVNMVSFNGIVVDCTSLLGPPLTMLDVTTTMRDFKRDMSVHMTNFTKSGQCENGADDYDRDSEFYDKFIKGDAVLFAVYLLWGHGRRIPAWNSTLLPEEAQIDVGTTSQNEPFKGKRPRCDDIIDPSKLEKLVELQSKFFDYALGGRVNSNGPSLPSAASTASVSTGEELDVLQRLRADTTLTDEQRKKVDKKFDSLIDRVCLNATDLTA